MSRSHESGKLQGADVAAGKASKRKTYEPPRLRVFGSVAKLTGTKAGSGVDGTMQMTCL